MNLNQFISGVTANISIQTAPKAIKPITVGQSFIDLAAIVSAITITSGATDLSDYYTIEESNSLFLTGYTLTATTLAGFGITSGDTLFDGKYLNIHSGTTSWSGITGKPTTLTGFGIISGDTLFDKKYLSYSSGATITNILNSLPSYALSATTLAGYNISSGDTLFDLKYQPIGSYLTNNENITITAIGEASGTSTSSGTAPQIDLVLSNAAVINKTLAGYAQSSGTVTSDDSIISAIQKLSGNIASLSGSIIYRGTWDANTNTPTLISGSGNTGDFYKVSVSGTTNLDGITNWNLGDAAIFDGVVWQKFGESPTNVLSVFGRVGNVTSQFGDYSFGQISGTPITVSGYGITDVYTKTQSDNKFLTGYTLTATTLAGYKISSGDTLFDGKYLTISSGITITNVINNLNNNYYTKTQSDNLFLTGYTLTATTSASNGLTKSGDNITLGGTLSGTTNIELSGNTFIIADTNNNSDLSIVNGVLTASSGLASTNNSQLTISPSSISWLTYISGTTNNFSNFNNSSSVLMAYNDAVHSKNKQIVIQNNRILILDTVDNKGLTYASSYYASGSTDDRWIPDWGAVKTIVTGATGLTNYYTKTQSDSKYLTGYTLTATTLAGYGITDAYTKTQSDNRYLTGYTYSGSTSSIILTTTGSTGASTYGGGYLNIPIYSGGTTASGGTPTATVGLTPINGSSTTFLRSDAAPALDTTINPIWTNAHGFSVGLTANTINKLVFTIPTNTATLTLANNSSFITSGAFSTTLIATATTSVILPSSGVLYSSQANSFSSAKLASSVTDETGSGSLVFSNSPVFTGIPVLPSGTSAYTQPTSDNSNAIATTAFVQNNFSATTIYFAAGTFTGSGTTGSTYALNVSTTPTSGSTLPITSDGVYNALLNVSGGTYTAGAGITLSGSSFSSDQTYPNNWTTGQTISANSNSSTFSGDGLLLQQSFAATATYQSLRTNRLRYHTPVWNTTSGAINYMDMSSELRATGGAYPAGYLYFSYYLGTSNSYPSKSDIAQLSIYGDWRSSTIATYASTYAGLPYPSEGMIKEITDSPTTTWGASVTTGGGSNKVLLWYNGTNWTVIGK